MSIITKETEKKLISEYVQLSNKAKLLYKTKNYEEAIELFIQCEKKCVNISSYDKNVNVLIISVYVILNYITPN